MEVTGTLTQLGPVAKATQKMPKKSPLRSDIKGRPDLTRHLRFGS